MLSINGNNVSHSVIALRNFTKKDGKNRESNYQTILSSWDFLISFPNNFGLLFKMVLLAIEFLSMYYRSLSMKKKNIKNNIHKHN